jgi:hypothetical protein
MGGTQSNNYFPPITLPWKPPLIRRNSPSPPPGYDFGTLPQIPPPPPAPEFKFEGFTSNTDDPCEPAIGDDGKPLPSSAPRPPPTIPKPASIQKNYQYSANEIMNKVYRYLNDTVNSSDYYYDGFYRAYGDYTKINNVIDSQINDAKNYSQTAVHNDECDNGAGNNQDDRTLSKLNQYYNALNNHYSRFNNISQNKDVKKDVELSNTLVANIQDYYNRLPEFQKTYVTEPLNKNIAKIQKDIDEITRKNNFLLKEIDKLSSSNRELNDLVSNYKVNIGNINDIFTSHDINNKLRLYNGVHSENNTLNTQIDHIQNTSTKNDRESNFVSKHTSSFINMNTVLFYSYFIILFVLLIVFFIINKYSQNFNFKVFIVLVFILYPFVISYLELFLFNVFNLLFSLITIRVHKDPMEKYITSNIETA